MFQSRGHFVVRLFPTMMEQSEHAVNLTAHRSPE